MSGDDKAFAIVVISMFMGLSGSLVVGWPALFLAAAAIAAVAFSKGSKDED